MPRGQACARTGTRCESFGIMEDFFLLSFSLHTETLTPTWCLYTRVLAMTFRMVCW